MEGIKEIIDSYRSRFNEMLNNFNFQDFFEKKVYLVDFLINTISVLENEIEKLRTIQSSNSKCLDDDQETSIALETLILDIDKEIYFLKRLVKSSHTSPCHVASLEEIRLTEKILFEEDMLVKINSICLLNEQFDIDFSAVFFIHNQN